jgi:hypothetical protein
MSFLRPRILRILVLSSLLFLSSTLAQTSAGAQSTPHSAEDVQFYVVALGDHPEGYFKDLHATPGDTLDLSVAIVNSGAVPVDLSTFKVNAQSTVNGGFSSGQESDAPEGGNAWVDYPTETFTLEPGEQKTKAFTVSVPTWATPGQYVSGLMVETVEELGIPGSDQLRQKLGYVISLSVLIPGEISVLFELGSPVVSAQEDSRFIEIPIRNTGNYLVRPAGILEIRGVAGESVHRNNIQLGSVYAGLNTTIMELVPPQMPAGQYWLSLSLKDEASGAKAVVIDHLLTIPETADPNGVALISSEVRENSEDIAFANVDITLSNGGQQIPASNVTLEVLRDGQLVEEYPLAMNQVLLEGENQYTARYIPEEMWASGTYTFNIVVSAVDPNGGQQTILLDEELDATIEVP